MGGYVEVRYQSGDGEHSIGFAYTCEELDSLIKRCPSTVPIFRNESEKFETETEAYASLPSDISWKLALVVRFSRGK